MVLRHAVGERRRKALGKTTHRSEGRRRTRHWVTSITRRRGDGVVVDSHGSIPDLCVGCADQVETEHGSSQETPSENGISRRPERPTRQAHVARDARHADVDRGRHAAGAGTGERRGPTRDGDGTSLGAGTELRGIW